MFEIRSLLPLSQTDRSVKSAHFRMNNICIDSLNPDGAKAEMIVAFLNLFLRIDLIGWRNFTSLKVTSTRPHVLLNHIHVLVLLGLK